MNKKMSEKQLDRVIERLYYKNANGKQIRVLDIPKLFQSAKTWIRSGQDPEMAVKNAIDTYCLRAETPPPRNYSDRERFTPSEPASDPREKFND